METDQQNAQTNGQNFLDQGQPPNQQQPAAEDYGQHQPNQVPAQPQFIDSRSAPRPKKKPAPEPHRVLELDALYARQANLIDLTDETPEVKRKLKEHLEHLLKNNLCDICHLQGHSASHCWLNGSMMAAFKSQNVLKMGWWSVKQVGKDQAIRELAQRQAADVVRRANESITTKRTNAQRRFGVIE